MTKYEAIIIFNHNLDDAALEAKLEYLRTEVAKFEGKVDSFTRMGRRAFARPLRKRESGIYVLAFLTLKPDTINPLIERLTRLQQDDAILRVQITRAPKPHRRSADKAAAKEAAAAT
jgi:ribosomal protein S6